LSSGRAQPVRNGLGAGGNDTNGGRSEEQERSQETSAAIGSYGGGRAFDGVEVARCRLAEGGLVTDRYREDPGTISQLTPIQYQITQEGATEPAFDNEF